MTKPLESVPSTPDEMPDTYKAVSAEMGRFPWAIMAPGAIFEGELLGRFQRRVQREQQGSPWFYQLRLMRPARGRMRVNPDDEQASDVDVPTGEILNVDEKKQLEELAPLCAAKGVRYQVWIKVIKKQVIKGTAQTFWTFKIGANAIANDESDVPF